MSLPISSYPLLSQILVDIIVGFVEQLPAADRVTVGMPGMIRHGVVVATPHYITKDGPHSRVLRACARSRPGTHGSTRARGGRSGPTAPNDFRSASMSTFPSSEPYLSISLAIFSTPSLAVLLWHAISPGKMASLRPGTTKGSA